MSKKKKGPTPRKKGKAVLTQPIGIFKVPCNLGHSGFGVHHYWDLPLFEGEHCHCGAETWRGDPVYPVNEEYRMKS